jgi:hypothetical protein
LHLTDRGLGGDAVFEPVEICSAEQNHMNSESKDDQERKKSDQDATRIHDQPDFPQAFGREHIHFSWNQDELDDRATGTLGRQR